LKSRAARRAARKVFLHQQRRGATGKTKRGRGESEGALRLKTGARRLPDCSLFRARCAIKGHVMSEHIYKKIELIGSSPKSIDEAVKNAIKRAGKTLRNMRWFEVSEIRGHLDQDAVAHWQVTIKVGFTLDE
jgi:flavin-binding protein dodecin